MLYPTAGARLYISDAPGRTPGSAGFWVEIGETEALGPVGTEWEAVQQVVAGDVGPGRTHIAKSHAVATSMQIILGNDPEDAGQLMLWKAVRSEASFPFRLVDAAGQERSWSAQIMGLFEVFDTANSIMKLQADLLLDGTVTRSVGQ